MILIMSKLPLCLSLFSLDLSQIQAYFRCYLKTFVFACSDLDTGCSDFEPLTTSLRFQSSSQRICLAYPRTFFMQVFKGFRLEGPEIVLALPCWWPAHHIRMVVLNYGLSMLPWAKCMTSSPVEALFIVDCNAHVAKAGYYNMIQA